MSVGYAGELDFTLEHDHLPQNIAEEDLFSFWLVLSEFAWSNFAPSLLKGFLGIATVSGDRLAFLEE